MIGSFLCKEPPKDHRPTNIPPEGQFTFPKSVWSPIDFLNPTPKVSGLSYTIIFKLEKGFLLLVN